MAGRQSAIALAEKVELLFGQVLDVDQLVPGVF